MKITNKFNVPQEWVLAAEATLQPPSEDLYRFRVSRLMEDPLKDLLTRHFWDELEIDVTELKASLVGTAVHEFIEKYPPPGFEVEKSLVYRQNKNITITGTVDLISKDEAIIRDHKTSWIIPNETKLKEWTERANLYCLLARETQGLEIKKVTYTAIIGSWSIWEFGRKYPDLVDDKNKVVKQDLRTENPGTWSYPPCSMVPYDLPIWDKKLQEKFLLDRLNLHLVSIQKYLEDPIEFFSQNLKCEDTWTSSKPFALLIKGRKKALVTGDSLEEVREKVPDFVEKGHDKDKMTIEKREVFDRKCTGYCPVKNQCPYYKSKYLSEGN